MFLRSRFIKQLGFTVIFILFLSINLINGKEVIAPEEDVYIRTAGGGEGCNPFLKYDISSVPSGVVIDSAFLQVFVWQVDSAWDGDVNYWNVNNQTWTESDSAGLIWNLPISDSTHQSADFGLVMGWTQSVDLKDIFLTDYNVGNTYCSIKMKDPDDPTFMIQPGSYPFNSNDTISLGNRVFAEHIIFYPHEYPNAPPWLLVYYHEVGVDEGQDCKAEIPQTLKIIPNPFSTTTHISLILPSIEHSAKGIEQSAEGIGQRVKNIRLKIYDLSGRLVKSVPVTTNYLSLGTDLMSGIYFLKVKGYEPVKIVKLR